MKNFTKELKAIIKEDPGAPIMSPDEVIGRANTMVVLTNDAPRELLALAGPSRKAILLNFKPLMITFPDQKGVYKVQPDDIVFENHHTGRDVTEAGSEETAYEKFFASAMKKFGVSSPIDLNPEDTKKFFNYVDKNWEAEEESDGSQTEVLPAIGAAVGGLARGAMAVGRAASAVSALGGDDENEADVRDIPMDDSFRVIDDDVSTGKVGKKDKGSYQKAYKLALKKYQIHSADELDTPAERKGFTAYVDKLWKGGEVKEDNVEEIAPALAMGARAAAKGVGKLASTGAKKLAKSGVAKKAVGGVKKGIKKLAKSKPVKDMGRELGQAAADKGTEIGKEKIAGIGKKKGGSAANKKKARKKRIQQQQRAQQNKKKDIATALRKEREKEKVLKRKLFAAKREKAEREKEQDDRQREKEQQQDTRDKIKDYEKDNGDSGRDDDKKDKKKNGFFKGLAGAVKQAADKEKAFVGGN